LVADGTIVGAALSVGVLDGLRQVAGEAIVLVVHVIEIRLPDVRVNQRAAREERHRERARA
jgi:hypothetical protein